MKLTEVFPASTLPVRSGIYRTWQVDPEGVIIDHSGGYSYFDATDKIWGCSHLTVDEAAAKPEFEFAWQQKNWQGVAEEPTP